MMAKAAKKALGPEWDQGSYSFLQLPSLRPKIQQRSPHFTIKGCEGESLPIRYLFKCLVGTILLFDAANKADRVC